MKFYENIHVEDVKTWYSMFLREIYASSAYEKNYMYTNHTQTPIIHTYLLILLCALNLHHCQIRLKIPKESKFSVQPTQDKTFHLNNLHKASQSITTNL